MSKFYFLQMIKYDLCNVWKMVKIGVFFIRYYELNVKIDDILGMKN